MENAKLITQHSKSAVYTGQIQTFNEASGSRSNTRKASRSFTYRFYPEVQVVPETEPTASTQSIFLMIFINFLSNVVFSIVLPTLPFFLEEVNAPSYLNGWAVAANSLGTFIASPVFGWWADKRNFREVFFVSLVLMAVGNVWYALSNNEYHIFVARFVVGIAAANYAPATSYLSYATSTSVRAKIMSWNAASSVLGFICGPAFSLLTSMPALHFTIQTSSISVSFDSNTAPGWISAFFSLLGLISLIPFKEVKRTTVPLNNSLNSDLSEKILPSTTARSFRSLSLINKSRVPLRGVVVCLFFAFTLTTAFTVFETTCPLYTEKYYGFNDWDNSLLFLVISIGCLAALFFLQAFLYFIPDERILLTIFGVICTAGLIVLFDWNNGSVPLWRFYFGVGLTACGYADGNAVLVALFSKILEEQEQGMMMGWFSSAGAIARMTAPIVASYVFDSFSENYILLSVSVLCFLACCATVFGWSAIDPKKHARDDSYTH